MTYERQLMCYLALNITMKHTKYKFEIRYYLSLGLEVCSAKLHRFIHSYARELYDTLTVFTSLNASLVDLRVARKRAIRHSLCVFS